MKHLMSEKTKNNPKPRQQMQEMLTIMTEINEIDTKTKIHWVNQIIGHEKLTKLENMSLIS